MSACLDAQVVGARRNFVITVRAQIILGILFLLLLGFKVAVKVRTVGVGYDLAELRQEAVELDLRRRELELQRSIVMRPDNLSYLAASKLGLRPMDPARARRIYY